MHTGFRLYTLTVNKRGSEPHEWSDEDINHLVRAIQQLHGLGTRFGSPRSQADDGEAEHLDFRRSKPAFAVSDGPVWLDDRHLHFTVARGEQGLHDFLDGEDGSRELIRDRSAQAVSRVDIWFPHEGPRAFVAMETVQGRSPQPELQSWLNDTQHKAVKMAKQSDGEARAAAKDRGEDPPPAVTRHALYFRMVGAVDGAHIKELIDEAENATLVLAQSSASGPGDRQVRERELRWRAVSETMQEKLVRIVRRWGGEADRSAEIALVQEDMSLSDEALTQLDLDFDEVRIELDARGVGKRTFTPESVDKIFNYPVAGGVAVGHFYYDRVIDRARHVARELEIPVTIQSGKAVAECLLDLIPHPSSETLGQGSADEGS